MAKAPYTPRAVRGVELKSAPLPGVDYQDAPSVATEIPARAAPAVAEEAVITFGNKHKGKQLIHVLHDDPAYLLWLSETDWLDEKYPELACAIDQVMKIHPRRFDGIHYARRGPRATIAIAAVDKSGKPHVRLLSIVEPLPCTWEDACNYYARKIFSPAEGFTAHQADFSIQEVQPPTESRK